MVEPERPIACFDPLHPRGYRVFVLLVLMWVAAWWLPAWPPPWLATLARWSGYPAAALMAVPYCHILPRCWRYRFFRAERWLRWHIGTSYLACFLVLIHSGGRAGSVLTVALVVLLWAVMLFGVTGFYGQKLLYRLMPLIVEREVGRARLPERCAALATERLREMARFSEIDIQDIADWPALCRSFVPT